MNKQLVKLSRLPDKETLHIIGCMSGTSLDGLDLACCSVTGTGSNTEIVTHAFKTAPYTDTVSNRLRLIRSAETVSTEEVTRLHSELGFLYADLITDFMNELDPDHKEIDLISSHGQTVFHAPDLSEDPVHSTLQIVDGDHIAQGTGIITLSDFRQKHTAAGGEGAPLATLMDEALFQDEVKDRLLINLGGIANISWIPSKKSSAKVIYGDTGPANTLINEAMEKYFDKAYDEDGKIAAEGVSHSGLVKYVLLEPYFRREFPKTTGQETFSLSYIEELMKGHRIELTPKDLVATLTQITIQSISRAADEIAAEGSFEYLISGGGVHNHTLIKGLKERLINGKELNYDRSGITADSKEAVLMCFLANELIRGDGFMIGDNRVHLGKISLPD